MIRIHGLTDIRINELTNIELTNMEDYCENVISSLGEGIVAVDNNYTITLFNPEAERIFGLSKALCLGQSIFHIFKSNSSLVDLVIESYEADKTISHYGNTLVTGDGNLIKVGLTVSPVANKYGKVQGAVVSIKDISRWETLEKNLINLNRVESFRTFTAQLAHEIKNPLGGIRGAAQLLKREIGSSELIEYTEVIIREIDRINRFVERSIELSRPIKLELKKINIHQTLQEVLSLVEIDMKKRGIYLVMEFDPSLPMILGDMDILKQVFLNLIKNGLEAMGKGGKLKIATKMVTDYHLVRQRRKSNFIGVDIEDTGVGIDEEWMDRIFTPFFTTKPKGSGLGLAFCQKYVGLHSGVITFIKKSQGTIFSVFLPTTITDVISH